MGNLQCSVDRIGADARKIGDFECSHQEADSLGKGVFGEIWKGTHKSTKTAVAVRRVSQPVPDELRNEISILRTLNHPNIVNVLGFGSDASDAYIVVDYCDTNLERLREIAIKFSGDETQQIVHQLVSGYKVLYDARIVHGCIKPRNILVRRVSEFEVILKLSDIGRPRISAARSFKPDDDYGDFLYMAPELGAVHFMNAPLECDYQADFWSLGLIFNECVGGQKMKKDRLFELFKAVKEMNHRRLENAMDGVIPRATDPILHEIITSCLQPWFASRMTAEQLFSYPYVRIHIGKGIAIPDSLLTRTAGKEKPKVSVFNLTEHKSEGMTVVCCAWSPTEGRLVTGCDGRYYGSGSAQVWTIPSQLSSADQVKLSRVETGADPQLVCLAWKGVHKDDSSFAFGTDNGYVCAATKDGQLELEKSFEPSEGCFQRATIRALKWNAEGNSLLSACADSPVVVWDMKNKKVQQRFDLQSGWVNDFDWQTNDTFAVASNTVHICKLRRSSSGSAAAATLSKPLKTFTGHEKSVNSIRWNPECKIFASASSDKSVRLWDPNSETNLRKLEAHTQDVRKVRWRPCGQSVLASASDDATVRFWDVEAGRLLHTLDKHSHAVDNIAYAPDGKLLASFSIDQDVLFIWDTTTTQVVHSQCGERGVWHCQQWRQQERCAWSPSGNQIAVGFGDGTVTILDVRQLRTPLT